MPSIESRSATYEAGCVFKYMLYFSSGSKVMDSKNGKMPSTGDSSGLER